MNLPDQMQAWPDESREQVADLMFYWRAGVGLERIASELALDHCYVRRALLLYRSEKSEPIASILREVQIGDIAELRRSYLLIQKPVLWQRVTGKPMSEEESKFLKLVIEMSIPPHELPNYNANFWDRGALSIQVRTALLSTAERERFLEFAKRLNAVTMSEQERIFQDIEARRVPHFRAIMKAHRQDEQTQIKMFATRLPVVPRLTFDWAESTRKNCLGAYVWLNMGCSPDETALHFDVPQCDIERLALILLLVGGHPFASTACCFLELLYTTPPDYVNPSHRRTMKGLLRDFLLMRNMNVMGDCSFLSTRQYAYLNGVCAEQSLDRWQSSGLTYGPLADDDGYIQFQNDLRQKLIAKEKELLSDLKTRKRRDKLTQFLIKDRLAVIDEQSKCTGSLVYHEAFYYGSMKLPEGQEEKYKKLASVFGR